VTARLEASGVAVERGGRPVLHDVSLALEPGVALALIGPNAAGKSTLVRTLAGLLAPASGAVQFEGRPLAAWAREELARGIALVAPDEEAPDTLTVEDRVALGRYPHRGPFRSFTPTDHECVARALSQTGIGHLARRRLGTLSAGERQLAALARGLAQQPRVLLLDEPGAHLDIGHQLALFRVLDGVRAGGVAVLAVVHDLARAAAWAERMVLLDAGRVAADGFPVDVLSGEACGRAFGVRIEAHALPGVRLPLWSFEEEEA
jgi:ABC-type cobalamin/Fe3+-siderophores transport system ATPase subunit